MKKMELDSILVKLKYGLEFLIYTTLFCMISPFVLLLVFCPCYLYRYFVIGLQKLIHPDWVGILEVYDAVMSEPYNKRRSNYLSVSLHVMRGSPNIEKIRKDFLEKIYLQKNSKGGFPYEKFSYYTKDWLGFRFWKKDMDFNVENHIKLIRLKTVTESEQEKSSGSGCYIKLADDFSKDSFAHLEKISEERLYKSLGDDALTSDTSQMPRERSPWELLILPNYYPKSPDSSHREKKEHDFFVIILRFHHTLFDGFSLKKMISVNLSGEKIKSEVNKPKKNIFSDITLQALINAPTIMLRFFVFGKDKNDWHIPPEKLSENWHSAILDPIPFNIARNVSKKMGVSPNSVVFGALGGGIQRMWKLQNKIDKLPKYMRVPFPWSIEDHPMDGLVNRWSYGEFQLPLSTTMSQKERILNLEEQFQWQKRAKIPEITWKVAPLFEALPNCLVDVFCLNRHSTLSVSNFPGPRDQLVFLDEWPLEDWTFCVPKARCNSAFQFAIMSYRGWIRIVLNVNTAVMPLYSEVQKFGQCIKEEFLDLENMVK